MTKKAPEKTSARAPTIKPFDLEAWWAKIDQYRDIPFMPEGRQQPPMPVDDRKYFDD